MTFRGKHPGQKEQIAWTHRFHEGAKRLRRRRKREAKFFQALLGTYRQRAVAAYPLGPHVIAIYLLSEPAR